MRKVGYDYFYKWRNDRTWQRVHDTLRDRVRRQAGRKTSPSMAIIDSQSVKTTEQGGPRGKDAHKMVNGRERHIQVDTLGLILSVVVHDADIQDRDGARPVLERIKGCFERLTKILTDGIYNGGIAEWAEQFGGWVLEIAPKPERKKGEPFKVMKWRWIVERTFARLGRCRRLPERRAELLRALEDGSFGEGCPYGDPGEMLRTGRVDATGTIRWVEVCYCRESYGVAMEEDLPHLEAHLTDIEVADARSPLRREGYPTCNDCDCTRKVRFEGEPWLDHLRRTVAVPGNAPTGVGRPTRWLGWRGEVRPEEARRNREGTTQDR